MDEVTEVTNKTLGAILISQVNKNTKDWDTKLGHVELITRVQDPVSQQRIPF